MHSVRQCVQRVLNIESVAEKRVNFRDVYRAYCAHRPIHMMLYIPVLVSPDSAPISGHPVF